jgi:hypothetical protein
MSVGDWIDQRVDPGAAGSRGLAQAPDRGEPPPWVQIAERRRRLWRTAQAVAIAMLATVVVVGVVWNARVHYDRGLAALASEQYATAARELAAARILFFSYRDAEALAGTAQARAAAADDAAARAEAQLERSLRLLERADARLTAGDAAGTLALVRRATTSTVWLQDDQAVASAQALAARLRLAAREALGDQAWKRAATLAAALQALLPGDVAAQTLAGEARTGLKLTETLAAARAAARRGDWRTALRLALRVTREQPGFPGAAGLVAEARSALRPPPEPAATAPAPSPSPTAAPPQAPSAPAPPPP